MGDWGLEKCCVIHIVLSFIGFQGEGGLRDGMFVYKIVFQFLVLVEWNVYFRFSPYLSNGFPFYNSCETFSSLEFQINLIFVLYLSFKFI